LTHSKPGSPATFGERLMSMKTKSILLAICLSAIVVASISAVPVKDESGKILSDWISVHLQLVRTTKSVPHVAYSRHFAHTAIAFYEAVNAQSKMYKSVGGQLQGLEPLPVYGGATKYEPLAAANAVYAEMTRYFYSKNSNANIIDSTEQANRALLIQRGISEASVNASAAHGKAISKSIIRWMESDHSEQADAAYTVPQSEGSWQSTPPSFTKPAVPYWGNNRTIVEGSTACIDASKPPVYSLAPTSDYYKMVKDVYDVSQKITTEQKDIAWFWDDSPGKYLTVPGHWSSILAQVIKEKSLSLPVSSEAFLKMHIALHDAAIAAWKGKYSFLVVRPVTNVQKLFQPDWQSLIETPPHPEFPAAHATLSGAAASGLTSALGDNISFTDGTYSFLGIAPRKFESFNAAAREAGISRLYGGIHYRYSIEQGLMIGQETAKVVISKVKVKK